MHMMYLSCHCMRFVQTDAESALKRADDTTVCLSVSVWKRLSSSRRNNLNPKIKVADNNNEEYLKKKKTDTDTSCHFCRSSSWSSYLQVSPVTVSSRVMMHNVDFIHLISVNYQFLMTDLQDVEVNNTQV